MIVFKKALFFLTIANVVFMTACTSSNGGSRTEAPVEQDKTEDKVFNLQFKALSGDQEVNCGDIYSGFGPDGAYSIGVTDLRLYISNIQLYNSAGEKIALTLDDNNYQLNHSAGTVALIDFTDTSSGYCEIASEGTPRKNTVLTGTVSDGSITAVSFDVGVPQALMKEVIAATDVATDSPSPLGEMYWSWASGYRHFVFNFTSMDSAHMDIIENSAFHIGSRDCGTAGKALSEQESCGLLNTPRVHLDNFDPSSNSVTIDLQALFKNITNSDFVSPAWTDFGDDDSTCVDARRKGNYCVTGESFGVQCHASGSQSACQSLFPNFGLDIATGNADENSNSVFGMQ